MEEIKLPDSQPPKNAPPKLVSAHLGLLSKITQKKFLPILIIVIIVTAGIFSGLVVSSRSKNKSALKASITEENLTPEQKADFTQTFRDQAEGTIEKNDKLDKYAQGTHILIRPGGESQTAFLTSSVLDLDEFVGKKAKVHGETFGSSQVGWLMDVGKVEIVK